MFTVRWKLLYINCFLTRSLFQLICEYDQMMNRITAEVREKVMCSLTVSSRNMISSCCMNLMPNSL